uniref:Granulins domain-containing protein n=1 Tax=Acrobeloides nanus TaxID=290746 RepID=A0A914DTH7_9BILA
MKSTVLCMIFMFSLTYSQPQFNSGGPVHDIPSRDQAQPIPSVDNENVQPRSNTTRHGHMCVPGQWCDESQHCCPATTGRFRCCPQLTECSADGLLCNPLNGTQAFGNV